MTFIWIFLFLPNIKSYFALLKIWFKSLHFFLFPRYNKEIFTIDTELSGVQLMVVTDKLLRYHKLLLLLPLTFWMGVEQVFRAADYTTVSNTACQLAVCFGFVWGDNRETTTLLRGASEKHLIISFSNMNGTSLCVYFMYTKALLCTRLFYAFSYHASFQHTSLLNLRHLVCDSTSFGWISAEESALYS
jgi:hypothetical protein